MVVSAELTCRPEPPTPALRSAACWRSAPPPQRHRPCRCSSSRRWRCSCCSASPTSATCWRSGCCSACCASRSPTCAATRAGVVLEWLPFIGLLIAYDSLRGSAGAPVRRPLPARSSRSIKALFGGTVPTVTLQHWLWHGHVVWYDVIFWARVPDPLLRHAARWPRCCGRSTASGSGCSSCSSRCCRSPAWPPTRCIRPRRRGWPSQAHLIGPVTRIIPLVWHVRSACTRRARSSSAGTRTPTTSPPCRRCTPRSRSWSRSRCGRAGASGCAARRAVSAGDGVLARLRGRALRLGHRARLGLHDRDPLAAWARRWRWWTARRARSAGRPRPEPAVRRPQVKSRAACSRRS